MDPIKDLLEIVKLAKAQIHQNMALFHLLAFDSGAAGHLPLEDSLQKQTIIITKIRDREPVPEHNLIKQDD